MSALRDRLAAIIPRDWSPQQACDAFDLLMDAVDALFDVHGDAIAKDLAEPSDLDDMTDDEIPF